MQPASLTPRRSAHTIFTTYENTTGFSSVGYVICVGLSATTIATGQDAAAHLAEETRNPSRNVPLALFWSIVMSYLLGWAVVLVLLACSGAVDLAEIPTGHFRVRRRTLPRFR